MEVESFNKLNLAYIWKWDFIDDNCAICRLPLMGASSKCLLENKTIDTCAPIMGTCGHAFHKDCIDEWVAKRGKCPLCMQRWKIKSMR